MNFTFHKTDKSNNDIYLFEGKRYAYFGDVQDKDNRIVAKVYEHDNDLIIAVLDGIHPYLHEWGEMAEAVESETGTEASYMVWEAYKDGEY